MTLDSLTIDHLDGNQRELALTIGMDAYKKLVARYGGDSIYVAVPKSCSRYSRDEEICNKFTGSNYKELAREYGLSVKRIREILYDQNSSVFENRLHLFDDEHF